MTAAQVRIELPPLRVDWTHPAVGQVFCALRSLLLDVATERRIVGGRNGQPFRWAAIRNGHEIIFLFDLFQSPDATERRLKLRGIAVNRRAFG